MWVVDSDAWQELLHMSAEAQMGDRRIARKNIWRYAVAQYCQIGGVHIVSASWVQQVS